MNTGRFEIVVVRHGETVWNLENRMQGHRNSPLSVAGRLQAIALGERMKSFGLKALYTSDLGRAVETADVIGTACGLLPLTSRLFRERNLGIFETLTAAEMQVQFPDEYSRFKTRDEAYKIPDGESCLQFMERVSVGLEELYQRHPGERIGLVTHGGVLDLMMRLAVGIPLHLPRSYSLFNASVSSFSRENRRWMLETWGDICHLKLPTSDDGSIPIRSL